MFAMIDEHMYHCLLLSAVLDHVYWTSGWQGNVECFANQHPSIPHRHIVAFGNDYHVVWLLAYLWSSTQRQILHHGHVRRDVIPHEISMSNVIHDDWCVMYQWLLAGLVRIASQQNHPCRVCGVVWIFVRGSWTCWVVWISDGWRRVLIGRMCRICRRCCCRLGRGWVCSQLPCCCCWSCWNWSWGWSWGC